MKRDKKDYAHLFDIKSIRYVSDEASLSIIRYLSRKPSYAEEISRALGIDRQIVHYKIRKLKEAGIIELGAVVNRNGSLAKEYYLSSDRITVDLTDGHFFNHRGRSKTTYGDSIFSEFAEEGVLSAYLCVGSPEPHGEFRAISRDTNYAVYVGMHLGTKFQIPSYFPVLLDSEAFSRDLLRENLIVIGGPISNTVTMKINSYLPVNFNREAGWVLSSDAKIYSGSTVGTVEKIRNPFNEDKSIVLLAGNRNAGTLSAILAATRFWDILKSRYHGGNYSALVQGYDEDSDGIIDAVELLD